jgi:hypothetical protein
VVPDANQDGTTTTEGHAVTETCLMIAEVGVGDVVGIAVTEEIVETVTIEEEVLPSNVQRVLHHHPRRRSRLQT